MDMNLSKRIESIEASPIRKLTPYAIEAKSKGIKVYHLNIGQPDIKTPESFYDAINDFIIGSEKIIQYTDSAGMPEVRQSILEYYSSLGINLNLNNILTTVGGSEAITFGFLTCLDEGDEIIVPEPFYANYKTFARIANVEISAITSTIENDFDLPTREEILNKITEKTKAIFICNPNNPTGRVYSKEKIEEIVDLCIEKNLWLFSDEAYREFCYDGINHTSVLSFEKAKEIAVVFDSFSKRYSLCGARLGALISYNYNVIANALKLAQARLSPPMLEQIGAASLVHDAKEYLAKVNNEYKQRRDLLTSELRAIEGVRIPNNIEGAFYILAELPVDDIEDFCIWMLRDFNYNNETVMLAPGTGFYSDPEKGRKQARIAYVLNQEDLKQAMVCLREGLRSYK
jgi:aspartate aminotransferase